MNRIVTTLAMIMALVMVACSWNDGPSQEEFDQLQESNAQLEAAARVIPPPTAEEIAAATARQAAEVVAEVARIEVARVADSVDVWNRENPCPPVFEADSLTGFMTLEGFRDYFGRHVCDPYKGSFDSTGVINYPIEAMDNLARNLRHLKKAWDLLPESVQQALLPQVMNMVAEGVSGYVHPSEINRHILDPDWSRDIESVNPDWYTSVNWPSSDTTRIRLPGYGDVSRVELKVRIFWQHQGPEFFEAAKTAFAAVVR